MTALLFRAPLAYFALVTSVAVGASWWWPLLGMLSFFLVMWYAIDHFHGDYAIFFADLKSSAWKLFFSVLGVLDFVPFAEIILGVVLYSSFGVFDFGGVLAAYPVQWIGGQMPSMASPDAMKGIYSDPYVYAMEGVLSWLPVTLLLTSAVIYAIKRMIPKSSLTYYETGGLVDPAGMAKSLAPTTVQHEAEQGGEAKIQFRARRAKHGMEAVVGMRQLKDRLRGVVEDFRRDDGNGILLTGDPGNGKSFITEALAGEMGWNFLEARASELTSKWVGETTERVAQIFRDARAQAPVVLFLDEFDSFMTDRSAMGGDGGSAGLDQRNAANAMLTAISELNKGFAQHRVLVIAASNFREQLDEAGIREGRFDVKVEVPAPDFEARRHLILSRLPKSAKVDLPSVETAVRRWEDWSSARIMQLSKLAAREVEKMPGLVVDAELLRRVVDLNAEGAGVRLSESAPSLQDLHFPAALGERLRNLVKMLREPELVERVGGTLPRGAIFYGPAGTGKTAVAQALAKDTGWRFLTTTGSDLLSSPKRIDDLIKRARDIRPCIIFIDEAEGVLTSRQHNPYGKEVTNKLLAVLDGPRKLHDVFLVAATNFADNLDEAMVREGRFSEHFDFTPSDEALLAVVREFIASRDKVRWLGSPEAFVANHEELTPAQAKGLLSRAIRDAALRSTDTTAVVEIDLRQV